jgi:surface carbohydrate biosynthesis protein
MKSPRIALIVDHPLRDLSGLVLLARQLALEGAQVFFVPMYCQDREIFTLQPDFVLLNYLRKNNEAFVSKLAEAGIQYGILDTEGGFYGDMRGYSEVLSYRSDLYQKIRCNLIWGERMMKFWQEDFPHAHRLILTGLPRFDFYSPRYRNLKLDFLSDNFKQKPMLLINTKVAIANPLFVSLEQEIDLYRHKLKMPEEKIQFYLKVGRESIADTIELTKQVAQSFPQSQVVLRPHPHENHKTYETALNGESANISVHREGSVTPWILQSSVILHRQCTTAIEAALAGKPALAPLWVRTSSFAPDAEEVSFLVKTPEEMNELIQTALSTSGLSQTVKQKDSLEKIINTWLYKMDGQSHIRAAQAVLESIDPHQKINSARADDLIFKTFASRSGLKGQAYDLFNRLGQSIPAILWKVESQRLKKWASTQKYFTPQDIRNWSDPLSTLEGGKFEISWAVEDAEYKAHYPGRAVKMKLLTN